MSIQTFKENIKTLVTVTLPEAGRTLLDFIFVAVEEMTKTSLANSEKKEYVLREIGELFDILAPKVPVPTWFKPLQKFTRPALRSTILYLADGMIESVYTRLKQVINDKKKLEDINRELQEISTKTLV